MPKVSVIIPTYNNESTIRRAIDSVVNQTCSDWELIVVNDCGKDNTMQIVESYREKLGDKLITIENEKNVGAGLSRRYAIHAAHGEFVTFLDSDDELKHDFIATTLYIQAIQDADIVYCGVTVLFPPHLHEKPRYQELDECLMTGTATLQIQIDDRHMKFVTGKLFRKSLFDKFEFSERRVGEDAETLFFASFYAEKVRSTKYSGYFHHYRKGSLLADKDIFYRYCVDAQINQSIVDFLIKQNMKDIYEFFLFKMYNNYMSAIHSVKTRDCISNKEYKASEKEWKKVQQWYDEHREYLLPIIDKIQKQRLDIGKHGLTGKK